MSVKHISAAISLLDKALRFGNTAKVEHITERSRPMPEEGKVEPKGTKVEMLFSFWIPSNKMDIFKEDLTRAKELSEQSG